MTRTKTFAVLALLALVALAPVAEAQDRKIEITPTIGYRFESTISTDTSSFIDSVDVPSSLTYGLTVEYPVHPNLNVEFLWSHQDSNLRADFRGATPEGIAATNKLGELGVPITLVDTAADLDRKLAAEVCKEEIEVDRLYWKTRQTHIQRVEAGLCHPEADVIFTETLRLLERVSDHADNVGVSVSRN